MDDHAENNDTRWEGNFYSTYRLKASFKHIFEGLQSSVFCLDVLFIDRTAVLGTFNISTLWVNCSFFVQMLLTHTLYWYRRYRLGLKMVEISFKVQYRLYSQWQGSVFALIHRIGHKVPVWLCNRISEQ